MNNKIKTIIATIGGISILSFTAPLIPGGQTYTVNEWQLIGQIYDYEIQILIKANPENEKLLVQDFDSQETFIEELNKKILERTVTEEVTVNGEKLKPEQYQKIRDDLINKRKNKTVVQLLIK